MDRLDPASVVESETVAGPSEQSPSSRRALLRRSGVGLMLGLPAAIGLATPATAEARRATNLNDMESSREEFRSIRQHENDHVAFLVRSLGSAARPKPTFQNLSVSQFSQFRSIAQALENTGVGAYLGAAPAIADSTILGYAGSIMAVEARHAGWLNSFNDAKLTKQALSQVKDPSFERPLTPAQVRGAAGGFIASLNGGPPVDFTPGNDVSILNYALALEYLEAEFYNINVGKFF